MKAICKLFVYIALIAMIKPVFAQKDVSYKASKAVLGTANEIKGVFNFTKSNQSLKKGNQAVSNTNLVLTWPFNKKDKVVQTFYSNFTQDTTIDIRIVLYQLNNEDSILCFSSTLRGVSVLKGVNSIDLPIYRGLDYNNSSVSFIEIIQQYNIIPAGEYTLHLSFRSKDSGKHCHKWFYKSTDSTIQVGSKLRTEINKQFIGKRNLFRRIRIKNNSKYAKPINPKELEAINSKIKKNVKGIDFVPSTINNISYTNAYYKKWYLGKYEVKRKPDMAARVENEKQKLLNAPSTLVNSDLANFTSVSSSVKDLFKKREEQESNNGFIDIFSNWSNDQEPGSEQNNSYQEYRAEYSTKLLNIPVNIEGFYTTQDNNREAKASYIRVSYDVNKVKKEISESANSFRTKYDESKSKLDNYKYVCNSYVSNINTVKNSLYSGIEKDYGISKMALDAYDGEIDALLRDTAFAIKNKDKIRQNREEINSRYKKIRKIKNDVIKYDNLIKQYKEGLFYDSALVDDKLKGIKSYDDISAKQLAKSAEKVLPNGKSKKILAGLTSLNIGFLNEYESKYTMAGQTMKGLKVGYDFNYVNTTIAIGKTEYVSRNGVVDRYNTSMAKFDFKQVGNQKFSLIYFVNSPTRQVFESNDFKQDISIPTLRRPTHTLSLNYEGKITEKIDIKTEVATSYKKTEQPIKYSFDNTAIITTINYDFNKIATTISGEVEHVGKDFENNTLPYLRSSTDRYTLATKSLLIKSIVAVGVQYNLLKQTTFSSTAYNRKWGFDIRTKSKRYPNIYISYKPFSTFRSYSDTLSIQQRPLIGEVWTARGMYRIRNKRSSHNFACVYNQNNSSVDTTTYASTTAQIVYLYTTPKNIVNANLGWSKFPIANNEGSLENYFFMLGYSRVVTQYLQANVAQEISLATFGLQRYSALLGGSYIMKKRPFTFRMQLRYSNYRMNATTKLNNVWTVNLGVNFLIKNTNSNHNEI